MTCMSASIKASKFGLQVSFQSLWSLLVYRNRSQMTSQHVKNKKVRHETKSSGVTVVLNTL